MDMDSIKGMTIVGVVGDVRQYGPAYPIHRLRFSCLTNSIRRAIHGSQRRSADHERSLATLQETLRRKTRERSPDVPGEVHQRWMQSLAENVAAPRFRTLVLGIFAGSRGVPGNGRRLWCDGLPGGPALQRDWPSHGS
jgi:hypothetical protein